MFEPENFMVILNINYILVQKNDKLFLNFYLECT